MSVVASEVRADLALLPPEVKELLEQVPGEYLRDLAADLAWAALVAAWRPDALYQVISDWQATLEEMEADGDELPDVLRARAELKLKQVGLTLDEFRAN